MAKYENVAKETVKAWETFAELLRKDLDNLSRQIWFSNLDLAYRQKVICKANRIMKKAFSKANRITKKAFNILEKEIDRRTKNGKV